MSICSNNIKIGAGTCDICKKHWYWTLELVAEENAGEYYSSRICKACLKDFSLLLTTLEERAK